MDLGNSDDAIEAIPNAEPHPEGVFRIVQPFFLRALAVWGCFYILLAQSFAIWKLQTPNLIEEEPKITLHGDAISSEDGQQVLQSLHEMIPKLRRAVHHSQQRNQWIKQQLLIDHQKFSSGSVEDDFSKPSLYLQKLVSTFKSNVDPSAATVSVIELFPSAMEELNVFINQQQWGTLDSIFMIDSGVFDIASNLPTECSKQETGLAQLQNLRFYLQDEDEDILATPQDSLPISLFDTLQALQHNLEETIHQLYATSGTKRTNAPSDSTIDVAEPRNCLSSTDIILPWIDVGLDFIRQQRTANPNCTPSLMRLDLRPVLLKAVIESGVDASDIVLDADISSWKDIRCHDRPVSHRRSFRQWLDQPTLYALLAVMDFMLDWLNGKNDLLDDWMDRYIYTKYTAGSSESILSRMLASAVLDIAGHLPSSIDPFNLTSISASVRSLH